MRKILGGLAMVALAFGQLTTMARADTVDASCEVRKDGDKQKGKSGPCTVSQRQGYIDIDLRNGDTLRLSPAGGGQYHDQHHNKVKRTNSGSRTQEFKWEGGKRVIVTFRDDYYGSGNYGNGNNYGAYGGAGYGSQKEREDYQRGYRDGQNGRYDQYDHTQAYKDGVEAGERASGKHNGNGNGYGGGYGGGGYTIENIGNGNFEVKWKAHNCFADYDARGRNTGYTNCSEELKRRSDEIARNRVR